MMHAQFSENLPLTLESHTRDLPCTPHFKPSTPETASTPRLRTSMSSHSRLMGDDFLYPDRPLSFGQLSVFSDGVVPKVEGQSGVPTLMDLPEEIHQRILDMLVGELRPAKSKPLDLNNALRNWNHVMRHPRGRELASLALVTPMWRRLVQERLYRHIKIQGTNKGLEECYNWFNDHEPLAQYVRHVEFWVPVWERRGGTRDLRDPTSTTPMDAVVHSNGRLNFSHVAIEGSATVEPLNSAYRLSSQKAALDEIFFCASVLFPSACVLSIEGGHCKKPPMIDHFREPNGTSALTLLPRIRTLVLRGTWNIMRNDEHFKTIAAALPNVKEWHCNFTKPKSKAYYLMHTIIRTFPLNLTHLNICLEGFYSKKVINFGKMRVLQRENHLCEVIGRILPQLEALTLTGRVCSHLFNHAIEAAHRYREPRLKSLDLVLKNCCRGADAWNDGTGIHNGSFLAAFELLVIAGTRSLKCFPDLNLLRIRFVDLDAPAPQLNPYFQLHNDELTGIYSDSILKHLGVARPNARYEDILESMGMSRSPFPSYGSPRPKSINMSMYQAFIDGGSFF